MNYKKYTTNAFNLHMIKTDKFKTIMIKINFKKKIKKEDITYRNLLSKVLIESNLNHPTKRDLEIACEELYNLGISASNSVSGNYIITSFNSFFLNESYTEKDMNKHSIDFMIDLILKPNVQNKEFTYFDLAKRMVNDEINSITEDPKQYSALRLFEIMDVSYNPIGYLDDLEKITSQDLYKHYLDMLKSDLIDIFIVGNIDSDTIKKQIVESFNINTIKKPSITHFIEHKKVRKRSKTIVEEMPLKQAKLNIGFKLENLTELEKKYVMYVYTFILGGGPDSKLFKNIREKHSLCYNISCSHRPVSNIMTISAGINKKDFKKALSLIKKEISKISKGEFEDNDIQSAIITYLSSLKEIEDYGPSLLKIFESHEYLNFDLLDERSKNIINITKNDVINLSKKIHIDTIYLLGGLDEKNGN